MLAAFHTRNTSMTTHLLKDVVGRALIRYENKLIICVRLLRADVITLLIFSIVLDVAVARHAARDDRPLPCLHGASEGQVVSKRELVRAVDHRHFNLVVWVAFVKRA